jgi:protease-4
MRPPFAPAPKPKRSRAPLIIGILILLFIVGPALLIGLVAAATSSGGGFSLNFFGDRIAILEVEGVIGKGETFPADTDRLAEVVRDWADNTRIKGMVIDINSPGGSVTPTWELYEAIQYFKDQGKPVYASMGETAASGGYLLAMSADEVYATKSTLTGSIGVIFSLMGYEELFRKIGLEARPIKSGEFKDIGSGTRPMTEAEKELLDELIGNIYDQFLELVVENRLEAVRNRVAERDGIARADVSDEMVEAEIRGLCDGRIFSGEQAYKTGMVDKLAYRDEVVSAMKTQLGISEDTTEVMTPAPPVRGLFGMMTRAASLLDAPAAGMPKLEYRFTM